MNWHPQALSLIRHKLSTGDVFNMLGQLICITPIFSTEVTFVFASAVSMALWSNRCYIYVGPQSGVVHNICRSQTRFGHFPAVIADHIGKRLGWWRELQQQTVLAWVYQQCKRASVCSVFHNGGSRLRPCRWELNGWQYDVIDIPHFAD